MCWFMLFLSLLVILCRCGDAGIDVLNTARYNKGHLMFQPCKSSTFISLCNGSSSTSSAQPFASHRLPDGAVLDLCLEPADSVCCTSSESYSYAGMEEVELERKLIGHGAHRELRTFLTAKLGKFEECYMVIVERLSSGVFADMFELEGLVARGVYENAAIYGDHNLELPAIHSFESMVVVHTRFESKPGHPLQAQVSIPVHARYPPLSFESHVAVGLKFPHLLLQCFQNDSASLSGALNTPKDDMSWALLTMKDRPMLDLSEVKWYVPAGDPRHARTVASVTALFSLLGVLVLWLVSMFSYQSHKIKVI